MHLNHPTNKTCILIYVTYPWHKQCRLLVSPWKQTEVSSVCSLCLFDPSVHSDLLQSQTLYSLQSFVSSAGALDSVPHMWKVSYGCALSFRSFSSHLRGCSEVVQFKHCRPVPCEHNDLWVFAHDCGWQCLSAVCWVSDWYWKFPSSCRYCW